MLSGTGGIPFAYGLGRWRIVLCLMALTMCVCFVMFFFLPENSAIRQPIMVRTLPVNEFLIPNVPHHRDIVMQQDIHVQQDKQRLDEKIHKSEYPGGNGNNGNVQLDQPESQNEDEAGAAAGAANQPHEIVNQAQVENMIERAQNIENSDVAGNGVDEPKIDGDNVDQRKNADGAAATSRLTRRRVVDPKTQGIPHDEETLQRREKVKEVSGK